MSSSNIAKAVRYLLLVAVSLGAIFLFLLATASENTAFFSQHFEKLFVLNAVIVAILMILVAYQFKQLWQNLRAQVFGSRLTIRLVLLFALMALIPGVLVYSVSVQFLGRSIESWFDVRIDNALDGGLKLGRSVLDLLLKDTTDKAHQLSLVLADLDNTRIFTQLNRLREQANVFEIAVFNSRGGVIAFASSGRALRPETLPKLSTWKVRLQQTDSLIETLPGKGLAVRIIKPFNSIDPLDPLRILQIIQPIPETLQQNTEIVESGYRDYQELSFSRKALQRLYTLTLTLTLLLTLTSALALAVFLSERLSSPLALLAEGTRAVAQGDFSRRHPVQSKDELGVLTQSFNAMTEQLADARERVEENQRTIETTNAYLESILRNLSAGVLAFDQRFRLRTANPAASVILQQPLSELTGLPLYSWKERIEVLAPFVELIREAFRLNPEGQWQKQAELAVNANTRVLLMRGTRLAGDLIIGAVVVFDDISELIHAQREAAWGEVARRLAHEIKNPLTPIQLSAERLQQKLGEKLSGAELDALNRGTQTIVTQVMAMKHMVDDFAIYARQTRPGALQGVDLLALLQEVLGLYENQHTFINLSMPKEYPLIQGEPTRLRQVFHNLLQNSFDAMVDQSAPSLTISAEVTDNYLVLRFSDTGYGFPEDILRHAFEPYVTTKPKGTGLGLAIVKKIMEEHNGRITIENSSPSGARVSLLFPIIKT